MFYARVFQFAHAQARARARIGIMPDEQAWQGIVASRDLDTMIQRMRDHGLGHWVAELPRSPHASDIEQSLHLALARLVQSASRWFPARWRKVGRWMRQGLAVATADLLLHQSAPTLPRDTDAVLVALAREPLARRRDALGATPYARYLSDASASLLQSWLQEFDTVRPTLRGGEAYVLRRALGCLRTHFAAVLEQRRQWWQTATPLPVDLDAQWRLRRQLTRDLRALRAGEPFQGGLLVVYVVLELLQFERCRALLLARARGWQAPSVA